MNILLRHVPTVARAICVLVAWQSAYANPTGGSVSQGSATFSSSGSTLTIDAANGTFINWQGFNIGAGETTTFVQPSSSSLVWNQINDPNPSQILGNLNANGYVVLQNSSGFFVGGQAAISAHGLILTTASAVPADFSGGSPWSFSSPPPTAQIVNYGHINISGGGSAFLIANDIGNNGTISAPGGNIGLYAGEKVLVSMSPDGRGLSAETTVPEGVVNNEGQLTADAGKIVMNAKTINQNGFVQANSVQNVNGTIQLVASDSINLGVHSAISARGDSTGISSGGTVTIRSDNNFSDQNGSTINISGGTQGGNGGQVEISAAQLGAIQSSVLGGAADGFVGGELTIDPVNLTLDGAAISSLNSQISGGLSAINLQADNNIELSAAWNLANSAIPNASLTLAAGNNITLDSGTDIAAGVNWNVNMTAGASQAAGGVFLNGNSFLQTRNGNINIGAAGDVTVGSGAIRTIGNGSTISGGNITVMAGGNVNTGTSTSGFNYIASAPYYAPFAVTGFGANQHFNYNSSSLGGISTANGGNVTITAGGDVTSYLPTGTGSTATGDAGTGAFGALPGNVTITAGGTVRGHYVVVNGTGNIMAGGNIGTAAHNVALSLVNGGWTLDAQNGSIYLQEVRNPNGVFNTIGTSGNGGNHYFDYSPSAYLNLEAPNAGVYLTGANVPRSSDAIINGVNYLPILLPPSLTINAGSSGLTLESDFTLFPSATGDINITDAGDFSNGNSGGTPTTLLMSDSAHTHWFIANSGAQPFSSDDHGSSPIEINNLNPVVINVGGNMNNVILRMSKATQLAVDGDMTGCSFYAQNLHPDDVSSITVGGTLSNPRSFNFTSLSDGLSEVPTDDLPPGSINSWYLVLELAVDPSKLPTESLNGQDPSALATYVNNARLLPGTDPTAFLAYDSSTKTLISVGPMPLSIFNALQQQTLTFVQYDAKGVPMLDSDGHFVTQTLQWVSAADQSQIEPLYQASQNSPTLANAAGGYVVGGTGEFDINANSISLGNSYGILSPGNGQLVTANYAYLTSLLQNNPGCDINITAGTLEMPASTIAALGGGNVNMTCTGEIPGSGGVSMDLGDSRLIPFEALIMNKDNLGLGIYTSGGGDVNILAQGTVNVDSSRIATFSGGNIFIKSLTGDVNAGSGGNVAIPVNVFSPFATVSEPFEQVYANGIVAQTLVNGSQIPGSAISPGDITVLTPQGSIYANLGGILQEALNGNVAAGPTITLNAGSPGYTGNIDLGDAGVIGGTVNIAASGNISGLVISRQNSDINAAQNFSGTVLSGGNANLSAGGTVAGVIIGVTGVNASGSGGISATLLGQNVSVNGGAAQSTLGTSASATSTSQSASVAATSQANRQTASTDDSQKKKKHPLLERIKRVTVLLAQALFDSKS